LLKFGKHLQLAPLPLRFSKGEIHQPSERFAGKNGEIYFVEANSKSEEVERSLVRQVSHD
jgi:hypothetical protein